MKSFCDVSGVEAGRHVVDRDQMERVTAHMHIAERHQSTRSVLQLLPELLLQLLFEHLLELVGLYSINEFHKWVVAVRSLWSE